MGNWIPTLSNSSDARLEIAAEIPVPLSGEESVVAYDACQKVVNDASSSIAYLQKYVGNDLLVQKAMKFPKDDGVQVEAFEGMLPNIQAIKGFYELSQALSMAVDKILKVLVPSYGKGCLQEQNSLLLCLAALFSCVFDFDWAKMKQPAVQNDFSFYRRALPKHANNKNVPLDETAASGVSMFIAQASPMLASLTTNLILLSKTNPSICPLLSEFVKICCTSVSNLKPEAAGSERIYIGMVIGITLYDKIDPIGAFSRSSPIPIKKCVQSLNKWNNPKRESSFSTLQYSTRNFDKASSAVIKYFP